MRRATETTIPQSGGSVTVTPGFNGTLSTSVKGLAPGLVQTVPTTKPTDTTATVTIPAGTAVARFATYDADYPTFDNFMYDLFASESLGGNNFGYSNADFDAIVAEAKQTPDVDAAIDLFRQAEDTLVNADIGTIPLLFYRGDYAYNPERLEGFAQSALGLIAWEQITILE